MLALAELHEHGRGVSRDLAAALGWYQHALAGGQTGAANGAARVEAALAAVGLRDIARTVAADGPTSARLPGHPDIVSQEPVGLRST
jgi:TPR repeat protein